MKKSKELSTQNGSTKIKINDQIIKAIDKIFDVFPEYERDYTKSEWINDILDWYIRTMFTNGDDYIDRQ